MEVVLFEYHTRRTAMYNYRSVIIGFGYACSIYIKPIRTNLHLLTSTIHIVLCVLIIYEYLLCVMTPWMMFLNISN